MRRYASFWIPCVLVAAFALASSPLFAASARTFVASNGVDANPCSLTAPCRSFAAAVAQTNTGGEIIVLDSAGYGSVTITNAVSITASAGIYAGVSVSSGTGIIVNAPSGVVALRGLTITGAGGSHGIDYLGGATLRLDRVEISGFSAAGGVALYAFASSAGRLYLADVDVHNNYFGAGFATTSGNLIIGIERSRFDDNQSGLTIGDNTIATLRDVSVRGNAVYGMVVSPSSTSTASVTCDGCFLVDNASVGVFSGVANGSAPILHFRHSIVEGSSTGLQTASEAKVYLSDTTITRNGTGVQPVFNGENFSFGDNMLYGNGFDNGMTSIAKK